MGYLLIFLIISAVCGLSQSIEDDGKAPRIPLNDGNSIPGMGIGTFLGFDEKGQKEAKEHEVENAVKWALEAGYRLIDTAALYNTENQVGKGVAASGVDRKNVFVVTKLGSHEQRHVVDALRNSLKRLDMDYVDLYLIHFPISFTGPDFKTFDNVDYLDTWKGMEDAKKLGLAKSIGISNFNITQIQRLLDNCEIKPAVLQVEVNLNLAQSKLLDFAKKSGIVVMAYSPFGSLFEKSTKPPPPRKDDPILVDIAKKYNKTTPQIALRYLLQKGVVPIPKSINKDRIQQNIDVFDFALTAEEIETLYKFDKNYRIVQPSFWQDHPYYPFEKKDIPGPNPFEGNKE